MTLKPFQRYYTQRDFGFGSGAPNVVLTPNVFVEIGSLRIGAQQQATWGIGNTAGGVDTRRRLTFRVDDATGQIHGVVRFAIANATRTNIVIVMEDRTENLVQGVLLGEFPLRAREDSLLIVSFMLDGATSRTIVTNDVDNVFLAPITLYQ